MYGGGIILINHFQHTTFFPLLALVLSNIEEIFSINKVFKVKNHEKLVLPDLIPLFHQSFMSSESETSKTESETSL